MEQNRDTLCTVDELGRACRYARRLKVRSEHIGQGVRVLRDQLLAQLEASRNHYSRQEIAACSIWRVTPYATRRSQTSKPRESPRDRNICARTRTWNLGVHLIHGSYVLLVVARATNIRMSVFLLHRLNHWLSDHHPPFSYFLRFTAASWYK